MCQRLNTGESNNFYFGIFICIGPLRLYITVFETLVWNVSEVTCLQGCLGLTPSTNSNSLICMVCVWDHVYNYNEVQLRPNAVMQMLCGFKCVEGLLQVTGMSFIFVFIYGAALKL